MRYEIESNSFCSIVYLRVPPVLKLMLSTLTGDVKTLIYELSYMYTVIEDHCVWSFMLSIFLLSYKLSTGVSFVWVLKRSLETSRICQGQHSIRSPPDVDF